MSIVPTPEQQRILDLGRTSIRVRAGAGTGKTTTVALVISNLVASHGIDPERVLGMTFTNKAAAELADGVARQLPADLDQSRQVEVHTYHGFAAQLLSEFGPIAGVDTRSGVITPTFARQLIRDVFLHEPHDHLDMTNRQTLDQVRRLSDQLGDHLLRPERIIDGGGIHAEDETWQKRVEMAETLVRYNDAKAELRVVDYSDLVTLSAHILRDHPALVDTVRDRYRVLVLDEYQDTNPAQRVLISTIFGDGFPVIAVGDEDQTIYEWRGASAENFERFIEHFPQADGSPAHDEGLTLNRRSGQAILDVANEVRKNANRDADLLHAADEIECEIATHWASDALAEAEWIARQFEALHDSGTKWSDMAVLFRKNKDFAMLVDVLSQHDIPVEVANVGGLLAVPEIAFLRGWLMILQYPDDSAALAQILFGSSYRLGIADLAVLTGWLTDQTPEEGDDDDTHPVTLLEAIESSEQIEGLSDEAHRRVSRFNTTYRDLLLETQGLSLAETCRLILDRTRAWQDVESLPPNPRLTARLNLYRFLDLAEDWSPLAGRPSVAAFLDYLQAMEDEPSEELDSARLSGEEAVTLVTVHRAKGLEWENVAIPAVYDGNFPSGSGAFPDPVRFPYQLPVEFRLDSSISNLPEDLESRKALFRRRHLDQEWRVAYVAVTRAKRRLFVTGAYWYGHPEPRKRPAKPSALFELVEEHPASSNDERVEVGPRPEVLRIKRSGGPSDPLFPDGWQSALRLAATDPDGLAAIATDAGIGAEYEATSRQLTDRLFALESIPERDQEPTLRNISVSGLVTYAQCPKRFYWSDIEPLPRRHNPSAIRGTEIHRRIELDQRGQVPFDDLTPDLYDAIDSDPESEPGGFAAYEGSRFATTKAALIEAPFSIELNTGFRVRGRIDAIYNDGTHWEVVDFKSGRPGEDPSRIVQLQAYAVAVGLVDFGLPKPSELDVTFAYLGGGLREVTAKADESWMAEAQETIEGLTAAIAAERFDPTPGVWCRNCDFLQFCESGRQEVGQ